MRIDTVNTLAICGGYESRRTDMVLTLIVALLSIFFALASPAGAVNVNCPADSLQAAVNNANPGDTLFVSGTCNENVLVRNDKVRVFIQPSGAPLSATIDGGGSGITLDIRGKAISVTNMIITGGNQGIVVQRGSNAVIDGNIVQNAANQGITVTSLAFAVITNNEVRNNGDDGIGITESSDARIGWNNNANGPAGPNDIHNNGNRGIVVSRSSTARITSNNIHNNTSDGIRVARGSQIDASTNTINGNGGDGIFVTENSALTSGGDTNTLFVAGNSTTINNTGNGIRCSAGGAVNGIIATINGTAGQTNIAGNCPNGLVP